MRASRSAPPETWTRPPPCRSLAEEQADDLEHCWWYFLVSCAFWALALAIAFRA